MLTVSDDSYEIASELRLSPSKILPSNLHKDWKADLREAVSTLEELKSVFSENGASSFFYRQLLGDEKHLDLVNPESLDAFIKKYPVKIPRFYLSLVNWKDPDSCPVLYQVMPRFTEELKSFETEKTDPIGDLTKQKVPHLIHRYKDRVLFEVNDSCHVNCRFCFRKNLLNGKNPASYSGNYEQALNYISEHSEIEEVILSGGEPLLSSNKRLSALFDSLCEINHLKGIRIHTRMLPCMPSRFDKNLMDCLEASVLPVKLVTHLNHSREISSELISVVRQLKSRSITILNQSTLLKFVNADPDSLIDLFSRLYYLGVLPIYLHHPDKALGTSYFQMNLMEGYEIYGHLEGRLPSGALPKYVLDSADATGKRQVSDVLFNSLVNGLESFPAQ